MAALTLRSVKGSELTAAEIDANFTNLNTDKLSSSAAGYPAIRTSLNLDFANSMSVDPRITFTRASTATRVNANGLIEVVASDSPRIDFDPATDVCKGLLIEEQRTNLLTYSENFDNGAWFKTNSSISPNFTTSPDGTVTADKFVENIGSGTKQLWQGGASYTAGTSITLSFYAKAGERNYIVFGSGTPFSSAYGGYFNLLTGVCVSNGPTVAVLSSINIGNGWYRYSITAIPTTTMTGVGFDIRPSINGIDAGSYTGDGTSGVYVWGAQLEAGSFATSYIPSSDTFTSRASTATYVGSNGLIQSALTNVARYNYNPVNLALAPKLLLESASTNLLTYSEQFDNAVWWAKSNSTITPNATTAPDGTVTADKFVENIGSGAKQLWQGGVSFTAGTAITLSFYAKAGERNYIVFGSGTPFSSAYGGYFNLLTGVCVSNGPTVAVLSSINIGNGWYRYSITAIPTTTMTGVGFDIRPSINGIDAGSYTGDGTSGVYVWGAQLEASSFPTSYIPTVASQVTRAADISSSAQTTRVADSAVMTGTNFSSWYNQSEGTFFVKYIYGKKLASIRVCSVSDGTASNFIEVIAASGVVPAVTSGAYLYGAVNGNVEVFSTSAGSTLINTVDTMRTFAGAYKTNDFKSCNNGGYVGVSTSSSVPVVNRLYFSSNVNSTAALLNGHISKLSYYPKCLTNSELQALTTG